jgi:hypothetical protein
MEFHQRRSFVADEDQHRSGRDQIEGIRRDAAQIVGCGMNESAPFDYARFPCNLLRVLQERIRDVGEPNDTSLGSLKGSECDKTVSASDIQQRFAVGKLAVLQNAVADRVEAIKRGLKSGGVTAVPALEEPLFPVIFQRIGHCRGVPSAT